MDSAGLTAALVAVILALSKLIEWFAGRNKEQTMLLDPELARQIRETYEKVNTNQIVLSSDLQQLRDSQVRMTEMLESIAQSQQRTAELLSSAATSLERIDRRQEVELEIARARRPFREAVD